MQGSFKRKRDDGDAALIHEPPERINPDAQCLSDAATAAAGGGRGGSEDNGVTLDSAFFAAHGYVVVPDVLSHEELRLLQQESALLYARVHSDKEKAAAAVVEQMRETAAARVNADAYLRAREAQFRSRCGDEHAALRSSELMRTFLFDKLSSCAAALMGVTNQQAEDSSGGDNVFFFNEHYVVKPPQTAVEFRWHRDDYEQLGMCVHRSGIPPYLSAWCALDDVTLQNGPLRFVSQSLASSKEQAAADGDACEVTESGRIQLEGKATSPILAAAGAVIFFLSNVWHCSSCNESDTIRRAFYAQYSASQITATPKDPWPLSFAIPCHRAPTDSSKKLTK